MEVGRNVTRVDAIEKVTGRARYTEDYCDSSMLVAKVLHSTIANGLVVSMDTAAAQAMEGVLKVVTCFDVPDIQFSTAGHPYSLDPSHRDVEDRKLLNTRVRIFGDDIAAVVAVDELTAKRALDSIRVEYEEYTPILSPEQAMSEGATQLHEEYERNIIVRKAYDQGDYEGGLAEEDLLIFEGDFETPRVQHCHIENPVSFAYMEGDRVVVVSSTQIPHIMRHIVGQALGIPWGMVRIIKPYIGGGFGNKQDVLYEPLNAYLSMQTGGRRIKLELTREETFMCTRSRHAIDFRFKTAVKPDGTVVARYIRAVADSGGYASHGHAVCGNAVHNLMDIYRYTQGFRAEEYTVYTNLGTSGAMRGYGIPQGVFACESHMEDIALALGMDPIDFRLKNMMQDGYVSPGTCITCHSWGLPECIQKGRELSGWDEKRKLYQNQTGPVRRGIGMSIATYKTGVYPFSLEIAGARISLNQDGSVQMQLGATEIGQGASTVFSQMAADTIGIPTQQVHLLSDQDTDISPYDFGSYASRQSYVTGLAVKKTAEVFKEKLLAFAQELIGVPAETMDIVVGDIVDKKSGELLTTMSEVSKNAYYGMGKACQITAEESVRCEQNTYSFIACFAEVEVDMELGRVKIINIMNVHDCGKLINPKLAEAQVHGGLSMACGYALSERMVYSDQGRLLNGNLLDYKIPTSMDSPELQGYFVETEDPSAPYGNKALGEPPTVPPAAAIRNAVLNATGIAFHSIPLHPERLVMAFREAGLIG